MTGEKHWGGEARDPAPGDEPGSAEIGTPIPLEDDEGDARILADESEALGGRSGEAPTGPPLRLFLREPGWRIAQKIGSQREFCHVIAPGQDYYHRLLPDELYVFRGDERLCLACAERRGLLSRETRGLRQPVLTPDRGDPGAYEVPSDRRPRA